MPLLQRVVRKPVQHLRLDSEKEAGTIDFCWLRAITGKLKIPLCETCRQIRFKLNQLECTTIAFKLNAEEEISRCM